jgi:ferritin-like metal-binding protein YciE
MPEMKNLQSLLKHELEDLYSAEEQIINALPKMIENAQDRLLKKSLNEHLVVTHKHVTRLDQVKKMLGEDKKEDMGLFQRLFSGNGSHKCEAMKGLIKEGEKLMSEDMEQGVLDAAIIAACQKIEHYEISSYGTARAYALQLGLNKIVKLLEETLNEEYEADDLLTELAVGKVNLEANGEGVKGLKKIPGKRTAAKKSATESRKGRTTSTAKRTTTKKKAAKKSG